MFNVNIVATLTCRTFNKLAMSLKKKEYLKNDFLQLFFAKILPRF